MELHLSFKIFCQDLSDFDLIGIIVLFSFLKIKCTSFDILFLSRIVELIYILECRFLRLLNFLLF